MILIQTSKRILDVSNFLLQRQISPHLPVIQRSLGPMVSNPNKTLIQAAVFAQHSHMTDKLTGTTRYRITGHSKPQYAKCAFDAA